MDFKWSSPLHRGCNETVIVNNKLIMKCPVFYICKSKSSRWSSFRSGRREAIEEAPTVSTIKQGITQCVIGLDSEQIEGSRGEEKSKGEKFVFVVN